jgi:hypothetical protein
MSIKDPREVVIMQLSMYKLLTEHELAKAIAENSTRKAVDVQSTIGKLLLQMQGEGLIWTGELFDNLGMSMWACCLTHKGMQQVKK